MTYAVQPTHDRLGMMLFLAACLHLFFILGVSFEYEDISKSEFRQQSLEITVVQRPQSPPKKEEKADYLAQTAQSGGGNREEESKPTTQTTTPTPKLAPRPTAKTQTSAAKQERLQPVITQAKSEQKTAVEISHPTEKSPAKPSSAQLFASRDQEIAHLTAELARKTQAYAKLPKRKSISASTKEYKYAAYLDAWRRKVERIGNLNYPDEAKRQNLHGSLILHVAVRSDGSVEQVRVLRSSGHKLLDDAAVRIVRLAAPYSPFPQEINKETDILDITRTWQFLRSNQLGSR
jgi:protein TonB